MNPVLEPEIELLISARWVIPVVPEGVTLADHTVLVGNKRIQAIMPTDEAQRRFPEANRVDLSHHVLIPGLINSHGHAAMSLFRGIADDMPLQNWLEKHIWPLESRFVSEEFVYQGTELAVAEMLRGGTTCFADMYFFPDAVARVATSANMRVQLSSPVLDFPTVWAQNPDEYIFKATELHDTYRNSELVYTAFGPHAPYTISDAPLRKILTLADELDIPIHMHVHETLAEVEEALQKTGKRPLQRLADLGLLSPRMVCVHATQLLAEELDLIRKMGAHVVHCPESNLKLASGFCPVGRLLQSGINVALGTDGCASNNDLDMISEMKTAALLAKGVSEDASTLPAHQALELATINGARALGLEDSIGSIEPGKFADLTAVRLDALHSFPQYNPVSHLVYNTQASQVSDVWIGGKSVLKQGQLTTMEYRALQDTAALWQQRIGGADNE